MKRPDPVDIIGFLFIAPLLALLWVVAAAIIFSVISAIL